MTRSNCNEGTITVRSGLLALIYMQRPFLHSRRDGPWIENRGRILRTIVWSSYTPVNRPAYVTYRCQNSGQTHNIMTANNFREFWKFQILRKTLTNKNCVHEKGNVWYNSAVNFCLPICYLNTKNLTYKMKYSTENFLVVLFVSVWNRISCL